MLLLNSIVVIKNKLLVKIIEKFNMGESKRRKKILGSDYGKIFDFSKMSENQVDRHHNKFAEAWINYFIKGEKLKFKLFQVQLKKWQAWLEERLKPYTTEDRVSLVTNFMKAWEEILEKSQTSNNDDESKATIVFLTLIFYHIAFSYLSRDYLFGLEEQIQDLQQLVLTHESFKAMYDPDFMANGDEEEVQTLQFIKELIEGLPVPTSLEHQ